MKLKRDIQIDDERAEVLSKVLKRASARLQFIANFNDNYRERQEVKDLLYWIKSPDNIPSIVILTGKAKSGKSLILRDLLLKLRKESIPVLGIKVDSYILESRSALFQELGLPNDIINSLGTLAKKSGNAVILLDQIDSFCRDEPKVLNMYINLISELRLVENLRIVISCKDTYLHDPSLLSLNGSHIIEVQDLREESINSTLSKLGIKEQISKGLVELLKKPLNL